MMIVSLSVQAQDIAFVTPETYEGCTVMQAFTKRHSTREFDRKELSLQEMSNLLWATIGINSQDNKLTAPSCLNKQELQFKRYE